MAKMDLTQAFYDIAKAQGPLDMSKVYQQQAAASIAPYTTASEGALLLGQTLRDQNSYNQRVSNSFMKIGRETLLKLASTPVGKDEALNESLYNSTYDYLNDLSERYVIANNKKDEKSKIKLEAEASKVINTIKKFRADLITMANMVSPQGDGDFSASATGAVTMEVLGAIMNQDSGYDDVEVIWGDGGLNFNVSTKNHGVVNLHANNMLGSLKTKANSSESHLISVAGEAKTQSATGRDWDNVTVVEKAKGVIQDAFDNDEFAAWCAETLHGSENSYKMHLTQHPDIKDATYEKFALHTQTNAPYADYLNDVSGPEGKPDGQITKMDFQGDIGAENKIKLINALTDPEDPAFNKEIAMLEAQSYVESLIKQQMKVGGNEYVKSQNTKIFEDADKKIRAMELDRPKVEVEAKIKSINSGEAFWDWGIKGKKGGYWQPVPGKVDAWYSDSRPGEELTREQLLAEHLKIDSIYWGQSLVTSPKPVVNPLRNMGLKAQDSLINAVAEDEDDVISWLHDQKIPGLEATKEGVKGNDKFKVRIGGGEWKIFQADPKGLWHKSREKAMAQEIWDWVLLNYKQGALLNVPEVQEKVKTAVTKVDLSGMD